MQALDGLDSILRFAGAHAPPGELFAELSSVHGQRVERVVRRAVRLAEAIAERAPPGYEVFTVRVGASEHEGDMHKDGEHATEGGGAFLCDCMESVERDVRRWVGAGMKRRGPGTSRTARTARTGRSTRAGTRRTRSRSRSRAPTERSRTDTNLHTWDKDSDDELDEDDDDDDVEDDDDMYEEDILLSGPGHAGASVMCTLGFGLRRIVRVRRERKGAAEVSAAQEVNAEGTIVDEPELQRERRRADTKEMLSKSSYTIITSTVSSSASSIGASTHRTEKPKPSGATVEAEAETRSLTSKPVEKETKGRGKGRWVDGEGEVVVKASVLMSTTLEMLQKHLIR